MLCLTAGASSVYVHEERTDDDVSATRCTLQAGDFDIQDGQQLLSISRFIPDFKEQKGSADVLLSFKDYNAITNETTLNGALSAAATSIIWTASTNFSSSGPLVIGAE